MSDNTPNDQPTGQPADPNTAGAKAAALAPASADSAGAPLQAAVQAPEQDPRPEPEAPAAQPATHSAIAVDERAYAQYQRLAQTVLDSADIASRSAEAALAVSREMKLATGQFREMGDKGYKKARLLLAIGGGVMVVCLLFFLIMGVRMVSRIHKLDVMMEAVGKHVVDLNSGMESLDGVHKSVQELAQKQAELTRAQAQIEGRIDAQLKQSESLVAKVPTETARQVAATSDTLRKDVQGLGSRLQSQASAVQNLGNEVKALKGAVGDVDGLKRDVQALITLQRERYLEALQKNNASAQRERSLQYPRVQPAKPGEAGSAPSPTGAVPALPAVPGSALKP